MTTPLCEEVDAIGEVAGRIWKYLNKNGSATMTQLAREVDAPRDSVMQGVGWLAREGKVCITKGTRSRQISLI